MSQVRRTGTDCQTILAPVENFDHKDSVAHTQSADRKGSVEHKKSVDRREIVGHTETVGHRNFADRKDSVDHRGSVGRSLGCHKLLDLSSNLNRKDFVDLHIDCCLIDSHTESMVHYCTCFDSAVGTDLSEGIQKRCLVSDRRHLVHFDTRSPDHRSRSGRTGRLII